MIFPLKKQGNAGQIRSYRWTNYCGKRSVYTGETLDELWKKHRELFGHIDGKAFPLLIKILDANEDLSVQVHPDDSYAKIHENRELSKTECWYIID